MIRQDLKNLVLGALDDDHGIQVDAFNSLHWLVEDEDKELGFALRKLVNIQDDRAFLTPDNAEKFKAACIVRERPGVFVLVSGGNVQEVTQTGQGFAVEVVDVDNLKAGGMPDDEIDAFIRERRHAATGKWD